VGRSTVSRVEGTEAHRLALSTFYFLLSTFYFLLSTFYFLLSTFYLEVNHHA
jgi:hypothetical protein